MRIKQADADKYWLLRSYVQIHLPQAYYSKKIVKNMKKYGHLEAAEFGQALIWGTDPEIIIRPLDNNFCGVNKAFGCFLSTSSHAIMLDENLVKTFQKNPNDPNTRFYTAGGASVPIVGGTLLHELCHWGNFKKGFTETREMGQAFELATYGVVIGTPGYSQFDEEEEESIKGDKI